MRGPRRGRGAMLAVQGHLRRRLASRRGFPSARPGAGAFLSDVGRTAPLLPNLGLGGGIPFPSRVFRDSWLSLWPPRSASSRGGTGSTGQDHHLLCLGLWPGAQLLRGRPFFLRHFNICLSVSLSFCSIRRSVGRRENQAPNPLW